jgi:hypothetical protein
MDKVRIVLIQRSSIEPSLGDVRTLCSVSIFMNGFCVVGSSFDQSTDEIGKFAESCLTDNKDRRGPNTSACEIAIYRIARASSSYSNRRRDPVCIFTIQRVPLQNLDTEQTVTSNPTRLANSNLDGFHGEHDGHVVLTPHHCSPHGIGDPARMIWAFRR